jgi:hypothetical protein
MGLDVRGGLFGRDPALRTTHFDRVPQRLASGAGVNLRFDRLQPALCRAAAKRW